MADTSLDMAADSSVPVLSGHTVRTYYVHTTYRMSEFRWDKKE